MQYGKILFYYSVLVATLLFGWIIIFLPKPTSFIPLFIFLPIPLHFWLHLNRGRKKTASGENPSTPPKEDKHQGKLTFIVLLVLVTLIISSVSIFIYSVMTERYAQTVEVSSKTSGLTNIENELKKIMDKMGDLKANSENISRKLADLSDASGKTGNKGLDTLGVQESLEASLQDKTATSEGLLKITGTQKIDVYQDNLSSAPVIGTALYNQIYTYTKKVVGWYQIILPGLKQGWIKSQFVTEI